MIGGPSLREEVLAGTEDVVDLGGGKDTLYLNLHDAAGGIFKGAAGATLAFRIEHTDQHSWKADNRSGRITRGKPNTSQTSLAFRTSPCTQEGISPSTGPPPTRPSACTSTGTGLPPPGPSTSSST